MGPFGPFELTRQLARGGMGEIFLAYRRDDPERVPLVLKRIRPELASDDEYRKRMMFEAQVGTRLRHPNLVRMLEYGKVGDCHYLTMEHIRGYSLTRLLDEAIAEDRPPPALAAMTIAGGVLEALTAMHSAVDDRGDARPILHRDVTPSNVMITLEGRPVLIDFGIAKDVLGPAITMIGRVVGTARYMAPEHRKAEFIDARADVFSASVILFELFTARNPWPPMPAMREILRTVFDPPDVTPDVRARIPPDVYPLIIRGLSCAPEDRFASAPELLSALEKTETFQHTKDAGQDVRRKAIRTWVATYDISPDEELEGLVVDHRSSRGGAPDDANLVWSPKGRLRGPQEPDPTDTLPPAKVLTIPPLPPRRQSVLSTRDIEIPKDLTRRSIPPSAVAGAVCVLVVLGVLLWRALLG